MALPLMALGQAPDQQQGMPQNQPNEEKAPVKKKKAHPGQPDEARPEAGTTKHQDQGMKTGEWHCCPARHRLKHHAPWDERRESHNWRKQGPDKFVDQNPDESGEQGRI
jgi:hypothetical protein